jgi:hypothetical protein
MKHIHESIVHFSDLLDSNAFLSRLMARALFSLGGYQLKGSSGFSVTVKVRLDQHLDGNSRDTLADCTFTGYFPTHAQAVFTLQGLCSEQSVEQVPHDSGYTLHVQITEPVAVNGAQLPAA